MREALALAAGIGKVFRIRTARGSPMTAVRDALRGRPVHRDLWVLRDLSLRVDRGDRLAIIGRNGCGNTTLLRLLAGIYRPSCGDLVVSAEPRILFRSYVGFTPDLPVIDNVFLFGAMHGVEQSLLRSEIEAVLEFSDLQGLAYGPLKNLSVGQIRRLALSIFSTCTNGFLMLDEALDHVDREFRRRLEKRLGQVLTPDKTLLMTSHDPDLLARLCSKAIWLANGSVHMVGEVDRVLRCYHDGLDRQA